jgi:hypothetical protein
LHLANPFFSVRHHMTKAADKTKSSEEVQLGLPIAEFKATVDTLQQLGEEGKYQIFLSGESAVKLVGDIDEFRLNLAKRLGQDVINKKSVARCLGEIQMFLQICIAINAPATAVRIFEANVYDDDFAKAKKDPERTQHLRQIIEQKVNTVTGTLSLSAFQERSKRLKSVIGPILQDIDIETISSRKSPANDMDIDAPFLRIRLVYSVGGEATFPFRRPVWVEPPKSLRTFDLECDETDIDLILRRLLQAKELLSKAIEAKIKLSETPKIDESA